MTIYTAYAFNENGTDYIFYKDFATIGEAYRTAKALAYGLAYPAEVVVATTTYTADAMSQKRYYFEPDDKLYIGTECTTFTKNNKVKVSIRNLKRGVWSL